MQKSDELKKHITDLARRSYERNIYTFSEFLDLAQQSEVHSLEKELDYVRMTFFGGTEGCERQMVMFGPEEPDGYETKFPISTLEVKPLNEKFSDDLSHRDFLGAVMNLGIKREMIGDIIVRGNSGYIFCDSSMADFIAENLIRVRHTSVACKVNGECPESAMPEFVSSELIAASNRCDAIISAVYKLSRSKSQEIFKTGNIYLDGRQCVNSSAELKEGVKVSVRGYGKFIFDGVKGTTGKGRIRAMVRKYI